MRGLFRYGAKQGEDPIDQAMELADRRGARHEQAAMEAGAQVALWKSWTMLSERADWWAAQPALEQAARATLSGLGALAPSAIAFRMDQLLCGYELPGNEAAAVSALMALPNFPPSPAAGSLRPGMPKTIEEALAKPRFFGPGLGLAWCAWSGVAGKGCLWEGKGLQSLWALEEAGVASRDRETFALAEKAPLDLATQMFYACHPWVGASLAGKKDPLRERIRELWRPKTPQGLEAAVRALAEAGFEQDEPMAFWTLAQEGLGSEALRERSAKQLVKALVFDVAFQARQKQAAASAFPAGNSMGRALSAWFDRHPGSCSGRALMDAFIQSFQEDLGKKGRSRWPLDYPGGVERAARELQAWSKKRDKALRFDEGDWARAATALGASMAALSPEDARSEAGLSLAKALDYFDEQAGAQAAPSRRGPRL